MEQETSIKEPVRRFVASLAEDLGVGAPGDDESLVTRGIVDSLGVFKLVTFLEETFSIRVPDQEIVYENFLTIDRISEYVGEKRNRG